MASEAVHQSNEIEHARTLWDRAANAYAQQHENSPSFQHLLWPELKKIIDRTPMQTALDAGCGSGDLAGYLTQRGVKTTGIDFSPAMVRLAQTRHQCARFVEGDISKLDRTSLKNEFFDAVFCVNVLPNHPDYQGAIQNMADHLNPNGHLIIAQLHHYRTYRQNGGNYFSEEPFTVNFIGQDKPISRYHRPYSAYFNTCSHLNLECVDLKEIGVDKKFAPPELRAWEQESTDGPGEPVFIIYDWQKLPTP